MKRLYLYLFLILFTLQTPSQADDIQDFQIEGMSIGDSALDYFSENQIIKNSKNYYVNKKFTPVQNDNISYFKDYDSVDFQFKTGDKKYIIHSLSGVIDFRHSIEKCVSKLDEIVEEFSQIDVDGIIKKPKRSWKTDINDVNTFITYVDFIFPKGGSVTIACYDYEQDSNAQDHLNVAIDSKEFDYFITYEAYKE